MTDTDNIIRFPSPAFNVEISSTVFVMTREILTEMRDTGELTTQRAVEALAGQFPNATIKDALTAFGYASQTAQKHKEDRLVLVFNSACSWLALVSSNRPADAAVGPLVCEVLNISVAI